MTRLVETRRRRRFQRARLFAAIAGFGMLGLSLFGIGIAATAAPPAPAATPSILAPANNSMTADRTPEIQIFVLTDTDSSVQVYADGAPYCTMSPTGVGPYNNSCSGAVDLSLGAHTFTATSDYLPPDNGLESAPSTAVNVTIYDDAFPTFGPFTSPTIDTTPPWNGTGPIGGQITEVYVMPGGPTLCANVPVQPDGTWSCTSGTALPPGPYTVRASSQDLGGGGSFTTTGIAIAAPAAALVDDTFGPGWRTAFAQTFVQGDKSAGASTVQVEVSSDGGGTWDPYCTVTGADIVVDATIWFCNTPTGALQSGDNLVRAQEFNDAGDAGPPGPPITITLVTDLPTVTNPVPGLITNDTQPQFEGTLDAGATDLTVYEYPGDSFSFCFDVAPVGGNWSCTSTPLADGTYEYWAVAGPGQGLTTAPQTITIDTVDPSVPVITDPATPSSTTDTRPMIGGTGETDSTVNILVDGVPNACIDPAVVDGGGNWQCELVDPLALGAHNFQTTATDLAGNVSPLSGIQLELTVELPTATIDQTFSPWYTGSDFPQVQGSHSDNTQVVYVQRAPNPGGPWTPYCTNDYDVPQPGLTIWFCDDSNTQESTLAFGPNYLRVVVQAGGGAMSLPSAPILINRVSPPTITFPADGAIVTDNTPAISGTAPPEASTVDVELSGEAGTLCTNAPVQPDNTWSCTSSFLPDGTYDVYAAVDAGGVASGLYTFTVDTTGPPFPVIDTPGNPTTTPSRTPLIGGSAAPTSEVTVWVDGAPASCGAGSFQPGASGRWGCVLDLPYGTYDIAASARDSIGNGSGVSPTQLVLTVAPQKVLLILNWTLGSFADAYHPGDTVQIIGTGLPTGAKADAEIHSTPQWVGSALTDVNGTFTIDAVIPEDIEPGLHTFVVTVVAEGAEVSVLEQPVMIEAIPEPPKAASDKVVPKDATAGAGGDWQQLGDRNDPATPSVMTTSLDTIAQILGNPVFIATAGGVGLALLLFVAIPAELLNATISEQYERITKRIPRARVTWWSRLKAMIAAGPVLGGIVLTLLASIIFGFADPGFGFDLTSLRIVLACAIGLLVVGLAASIMTGLIVGARWKLRSVIEIQPLGIILAVVGVLISRLLNFSPGILIGLLIGLALVGKVTKADEGRTTIVKAGVVWLFALFAWGLYSLLSGPLTGTGFGGNLVVETMVAITAEGLTALLIGLLPFKFLEGSAIWNYNKVLWAAVWLGAAASWVLIVLPQNFGEIQGSIWVWSAIVGGFAIVALAIYLIFRFAVRPEPEDEADESESETQKVRLGRGR